MKLKLLTLLIIIGACTKERNEKYEITEEDRMHEEQAIRIVDEAVSNIDQTLLDKPNKVASPVSRLLASSEEEKEISRFVVSTLYDKKPSLVRVISDGGIYHASYINSEGERRSTKIQFIGNNIRWGNSEGRWRDHPLDEQLSYEINGKKVFIKITYSSGEESTDEYQL
ncbi:hypothetical protein [Leadbetterella sp. DM7]|uniref:hypothetical protein n=1 Tax=Leadbetterella sp. DM7 TaxID=3235085 RepID=UPI00349E9DE7